MTPEQEQIILKAFQDGKTGREAARLTGLSPSSISNVMKKHGLKPPTGRRPTCELDHGAFDIITPESAYWTGFLFADGCIADYNNGAPQLVLDLGEKDRKHVEKFRAFLKSTHTIATLTRKAGRIGNSKTETPSRKSVAFRVRSQRLVARLESLGMVKKGPERAPVPDELTKSPDFWRGCIDGDGTVRIATDGAGNQYASIILCGHRPLLEKFLFFLLCNGLTANITDTASGIFQVRLMGLGALELVRFLYKHATVALDRKLESARAVITHGK